MVDLICRHSILNGVGRKVMKKASPKSIEQDAIAKLWLKHSRGLANSRKPNEERRLQEASFDENLSGTRPCDKLSRVPLPSLMTAKINRAVADNFGVIHPFRENAVRKIKAADPDRP